MKKILLTIILLGTIGITGCNNQPTEKLNNKPTEELDKSLLQCLENELGAYLVGENDDLIEIPLDEIKNTSKEQIAYYKGVYASNHQDNIYVIVYPKNGMYDSSEMKDFDDYFNKRFQIYQKNMISSVTIYIHNPQNNVDFDNITKKCLTYKNDGKSIPSNTLKKLNNTSKIVIKTDSNKLGEITDKNQIEKILNAISSSKQSSDICLSDGYAFDFKMYNNDKLIDTIHIWRDGIRIIPQSINKGCYYSITNELDLRKIIEEETDYIFYSILDLREDNNQTKQLIYKDDKYNYYLNSEKSEEILIKFILTNQVMTLKNAIENNYISAEKVSTEYPDILIKK